MRILSYGHITPKQIVCNHCGATLEYTDADVRLKTPDRFTSFRTLQCACCGRTVVLEKEVADG